MFRRGGDGLAVLIENQLRADVAALRRIDAPQPARPFAGFGILAGGDIDLAAVNHRRGDQIAAVARCTVFPDAILSDCNRISKAIRAWEILLPSPFGRGAGGEGSIRSKTIEPSVAAGKDHLRHAAQHGKRRRGPLAVENISARRVVGPNQFAGFFVEGDKTGGLRGDHAFVLFIRAVARVHEEQIAGRGDRTARHVVRHDAKFLDHVEDPNDLGLQSRSRRLCPNRRGHAFWH